MNYSKLIFAALLILPIRSYSCGSYVGPIKVKGASFANVPIRVTVNYIETKDLHFACNKWPTTPPEMERTDSCEGWCFVPASQAKDATAECQSIPKEGILVKDANKTIGRWQVNDQGDLVLHSEPKGKVLRISRFSTYVGKQKVHGDYKKLVLGQVYNSEEQMKAAIENPELKPAGITRDSFDPRFILRSGPEAPGDDATDISDQVCTYGCGKTCKPISTYNPASDGAPRPTLKTN